MEDIFGTVHDIVIVGGGPAGLTAAIYASRADLKPVIFEGWRFAGGQLTKTSDVENFPGFPEGIKGPDLVEAMREQAKRFGTIFSDKSIIHADLSSRPFKLTALNENNPDDTQIIQCRTIIVSTGAAARWLDIPSEQALRLSGAAVSACATCDGPLHRGKEIAVVGGGDTAMEEAHHLTKFGSKVYVIHRRDTLRASKIMQERAFNDPKVHFVWDSVVEEVHDPSAGKVTGLTLRNIKTGELSNLPVGALFMGIGHDPNTKWLNGQVETDANGFIKVQHPTMRTSVPGVFACGDVMDPTYKQAITAAGTGCSAALDAEKFLALEKAH